MRRLVLLIALFAMPAQGNNPANNTCQVAGSTLVSSGITGLVKLSVKSLVTAYLNPVDDVTTKKKKKIAKQVAKMALGGTLVGLCSPIVVPEGFRNDSSAERRAYAIDHGWNPLDVTEFSVEVDQPLEPTSCSATVALLLSARW